MVTRSPLDGTVGLAMYPFDELRPAWQHLWSLVQRQLPWLPSELTWHADVHDAWRSPEMLVDQTCGWPLVTELADRVRVVGAFAYAVPFAEGPTYRSVLVARSMSETAHMSGSRAAANSPRSLSGWVSLLAAVHGPGATWQGPVVWTGSHLESVRAVRDGRADIASIDSVSWYHVQRLRPQLVEGLVEVGHGPRVASLPVIVGPRVPDDDVVHLRSAFAEAIVDRGFAADRRSLLLEGFEAMELADYDSILQLSPAV